MNRVRGGCKFGNARVWGAVVSREEFEAMCEAEEARIQAAQAAARKLAELGNRIPPSSVPKMTKQEALNSKIDPRTRGLYTDSQLIEAHAGPAKEVA